MLKEKITVKNNLKNCAQNVYLKITQNNEWNYS